MSEIIHSSQKDFLLICRVFEDTTTEVFPENQNFIPLGELYEPLTPDDSPEKSGTEQKKTLKK